MAARTLEAQTTKSISTQQQEEVTGFTVTGKAIELVEEKLASARRMSIGTTFRIELSKISSGQIVERVKGSFGRDPEAIVDERIIGKVR